MRKFVLAAAALLATTGAAQAATAVYTPGSAAAFAAPAGSSVVIDFNSPAAGYTLSGGLIQNISNGDGAKPAFSTDGAGSGFGYLTTTAAASPVTLQLDGTTGYRQVSFYWGSIDTYNTIQLLDASGNLINADLTFSSFTGTQVAPPADGNQGLPQTNGRATFTIGAGDQGIAGLRFISTGNSFEVDNIAFSSAIPEPATWAMMIVGFGMVGAAMRRRNSAVVTA